MLCNGFDSSWPVASWPEPGGSAVRLGICVVLGSPGVRAGARFTCGTKEPGHSAIEPKQGFEPWSWEKEPLGQRSLHTATSALLQSLIFFFFCF